MKDSAVGETAAKASRRRIGFHRKQKGGGKKKKKKIFRGFVEEEGRIKQTRPRWELSCGAVGVYPRLCYPFQMLLAALRGSAHVSALSSVVLPRLLHRSSATAAAAAAAAASTSLLTRHHHHHRCCSSFAGVRDVAGPEQCKVGTGGSRRRRVMQRRTNNIRSGAAERRTLAGGETLRRRSRREPSAVPSFAPRHTLLLLLLPGHITLHWGWRVCVSPPPPRAREGIRLR